MARKTLNTLGELKEGIPKASTIYRDLMLSPGWPYAEVRSPKPNDWEPYLRRERYIKRDRALVALLYVGCLRVSEALRLVKSQFKSEGFFVNVSGIRLSKRRPGNIKYREARLPLTGKRACFTKLVTDYLQLLEPEERLFPWSLRVATYTVKNHPYPLRDGTVKERKSIQMIGTKRAWHIVHAMLPSWTEHWLRAFGESFLYDEWQHDIIAVADQVKVDTRTVEKYLVHRSAQYKPA